MRRLAAALTVVAATAALPAWGAGPARAPEDPSVDLAIAAQDFGVAPGGTWTATVTVSGDVDALLAAVPSPATTTTGPTTTTTTTTPTTTTTTVADAGVASSVTVEVVAHERIDTTAALQRAHDGELGDALDRVTYPAAEVVRRVAGGATLELAVPTASEAGDPRLTLRRAGLYPLAVRVSVDGVVVGAQTTFVERLAVGDDDTPPLGIALVATLDDLGPASTPTDERTVDRQLDELVALGEATDGPLTVAMPPRVAQRVSEDPGRTRAVAAALATGDLLALPDLTLDPSSAVAIDRVDAFSGEVRDGEDVLTATFPDVPTQRAAWLVDDQLSTSGAAMLRDPLGYRLLVFDDETYRSLDGNIGDFTDSSLAFDVALGAGATLPAMLASPLGELLDGDRAADRTAAEDAIDVIASLVVVRRELGPELRRNVVLVSPDGGVPDAATAAALSLFVSQVPQVQLTSLARVAGTTDQIEIEDDPLTVTLPERAGVDLGARAQRIDLTRVAVEAFGSMLAEPAERDAWLAELDTMLSTDLDDATVDEQLGGINAELEALRTSVIAPEPFTFTLTGRTSVLRLTIRNTADEPRLVRIRAASPKLRFPDGEQVVTLQPGPNEVVLDVEARANGTSSVSVELLTPVFERPVAEPTFLTAKVNALTGLGQVITGGAALVLVTWWFSHFRRRRRERATPSPIVVTEGVPVVSPDAAEAAVHLPDDDEVPDPDDLPPARPAVAFPDRE